MKAGAEKDNTVVSEQNGEKNGTVSVSEAKGSFSALSIGFDLNGFRASWRGRHRLDATAVGFATVLSGGSREIRRRYRYVRQRFACGRTALNNAGKLSVTLSQYLKSKQIASPVKVIVTEAKILLLNTETMFAACRISLPAVDEL